MLRDYLLSGNIVNEQPLAHSPPDHQNAKRVSQIARISKMVDGTLRRRPFINSSALRGLLRRACADLVHEKVGVPLSFATALEQRIGGAKSSAEVNSDPKLRAQVVRDNIQLALFGAGSSQVGFIDSRLDIDFLISPVDFDELDVISSARRAEEKTDDFLSTLSTDGYDQVVAWGASNTARSRAKARLERANAKAAQLKRRVGTKAQEYIDANTEAEQAKAELEIYEAQAQALGGDVSIGMPLPGFEVLPAGLTFPMKMRLRQVTEAQAGLFLAGIERFSYNPYIGAHHAQGCGLINGEFVVSVREGYTPYTTLGSFTFSETDNFRCDAMLGQLIDAFRTTEISYDHIRGAA